MLPFLARAALLFVVLTPCAKAQEQPLPPAPRNPPRIIPMPDLNQPLPPPPRAESGPRKKAAPAREAEKDAAKEPPLPTDPAKRLDALFARLQNAEDAPGARRAEREIQRQFERSGSATADLMYTRAAEALNRKDSALALDVLDYALLLRPGFIEAYHRRAQVHMQRGDEEAALRDLRSTLAMEPRHFGALAMLAGLMRSSGNRKGAYRALTKLRDLNPHYPEIGAAIDSLKKDIDGQAI